MAYSLPNDVYLLVEEAFNHERAKAQTFTRAVEGAIQTIENQAVQLMTDKKESLKSELYNALRTELATQSFVRAETNDVKGTLRAEINDVKGTLRAEINDVKETLRAEINEVKETLRAEINELRLEIAVLRSEVQQISLLLKVLIGLTVFGLTLFNPAFVKLVELVVK